MSTMGDQPTYMSSAPIPTEWTVGQGRLGNLPREPSPTPLGWQVTQCQRYDGDAVVWGELTVSALHHNTPAEALKGLWARRAQYNRKRIPGGLEFDQYAKDTAPHPDLQGLRVRVTYHDTDPSEWVPERGIVVHLPDFPSSPSADEGNPDR